MRDLVDPKAGWIGKYAQGKMFERRACDRCGARFNFGDPPRATRVPRCPVCGSLGSHPEAA